MQDNLVIAHIQRSIEAKQTILADTALLAALQSCVSLCVDALKASGKLIIAGNGGSAADAQHIAAELVGRYKKDRPALPAIAITTDTSALTAIGNDYGYDQVFSRQVEALVQPQDVFIGISTSGNSGNILAAADVAHQKGAKVIGLMGPGGRLAEKSDIALNVPAPQTATIQECHIMLGHILCAGIEIELYGESLA